MSSISEKDWKIFKKIREEAIEAFCQGCLNEFKEIIDGTEESAQNRYLLNYRIVQNRDKQMSLFFDDLSRSKATLQLMALRGEGLANESLVSELSEELRAKTDPQNTKW